MTDKIIETPFTSGEPATLRATATIADKDFYKDRASKMFGVPYEEVTKEQRVRAKEMFLHSIYGRDTKTIAETLGVNSAGFRHKG